MVNYTVQQKVVSVGGKLTKKWEYKGWQGLAAAGKVPVVKRLEGGEGVSHGGVLEKNTRRRKQQVQRPWNGSVPDLTQKQEGSRNSREASVETVVTGRGEQWTLRSGYYSLKEKGNCILAQGGGTRGGEKWSDLRCVLKTELDFLTDWIWGRRERKKSTMIAGRVDLEGKIGCSLVQFEMPVRDTSRCPSGLIWLFLPVLVLTWSWRGMCIGSEASGFSLLFHGHDRLKVSLISRALTITHLLTCCAKAFRNARKRT